MVDFTAFESVSFTAHSAYPCQAASIGFGSEHMATMTSSSANELPLADDAAAGFQWPLCLSWIAPIKLAKPQVQSIDLDHAGLVWLHKIMCLDAGSISTHSYLIDR